MYGAMEYDSWLAVDDAFFCLAYQLNSYAARLAFSMACKAGIIFG